MASLAIGVPALLLIFVWLGTRNAEDRAGAGWLGLIVIVLALFAFSGFGTLAVIFASTGTPLGRLLRRIALAVCGAFSAYYGLLSVKLFVDGYGSSIAAIGVVLLPVGLWAFYELLADLLGRNAPPVASPDAAAPPSPPPASLG
jgi:hypothetical protein